jgi:hypothetical protein
LNSIDGLQVLDVRWLNVLDEMAFLKRLRGDFINPAIGVREMLLLPPLTRQVLFQRFGYALVAGSR